LERLVANMFLNAYQIFYFRRANNAFTIA
jgi:hypothetical protein